LPTSAQTRTIGSLEAHRIEYNTTRPLEALARDAQGDLRSPDARFTSVDVSADSLAEARRRPDRAGLTNVEFRQANIFALPSNGEPFDHVFVCFVLEHLSRPVEALTILKGLLRPGGTITVIEGDHGSTYFHP
jgi:ubiquinone/menaquinone biosynthesis C-methylase UbiE